MPKLLTRVSGAWVDTQQAGMVRLSGSWTEFGPDGLATEAVDWLSPPSSFGDDGPTYNMGCSFTVQENTICYGVQWRVPDSLVAPSGGIYYAALWSHSPNEKKEQKIFTPVAGGFQDIMFDDPYLLNTSESSGYIVSVLTRSYSFRAGSFPYESPSGNVIVDSGRLAETADPDVIPGSTFTSVYYVSPITEIL